MSDISTGQIFTVNQQNINAPQFNNIIALASINSSFISGKNSKTTVSGSDSFILVDNGGAFWRITGAALADGLSNAEPNYSRIAVGPLSTWCPLINGNCQIANRQTSIAGLGAAGSTYTIDKWKATATGAMTGRATVSQQSAGIVGTANYPDTEYCNRITVTTAQASLAAGDSFVVEEYVEQQLARALYDNTHSVSILLRSNSTGTFCVALRNNNGGTPNRSYIMECAITSANVFQRFTFPTIAVMPTGSGTWGVSDIDYSYRLSISAGTGSTFQTPAGSWATGNFNGSANQSNLFANNGATLDYTLVQHEYGNVCTPFVWTPFDLDLLRCQRYFYKSYPYANAVGLASINGYLSWVVISTSSAVGTNNYPVPMRALGTVVYYNQNTGAAGGTVYDVGSATSIGSAAALSGSTEKGSPALSFTSGGTAGHVIIGHITHDVDF